MSETEIINEIIKIINKIWKAYISLNNQWELKNNYKINFKNKNKRVDWLYNNRDSLEACTIEKYVSYITNKKNFINQSIEAKVRIKSKKSIHNKIQRYCLKKQENGKVVLGKCLNDIVGIRKVFNFNSCEKIFNELNNKNDATLFDLVSIQLKKGEYNAIHIYFKKDNNSFIWELQIWSENDKENNEKQHIIKYGYS